MAIDCVSFLSDENDVVQYLGFEVPGKIEGSSHSATSESTNLLNCSNSNNPHNDGNNSGLTPLNGLEEGGSEDTGTDAAITAAYGGLNALEIAIVAEAKYFLSQKPVQRVVDGM